MAWRHGRTALSAAASALAVRRTTTLMPVRADADRPAVERLPDLLAGEPVYWVERLTVSGDGRLRTELGFSDVAAHPYERLVAGTVEMLRHVPGVVEVTHEDREVVHVTSRGLAPEHIADLVDRFWFTHLPTAPIDPGFETTPAEVLASPWPAAPPPPRGAMPPTDRDHGAGLHLRDVVSLPPSRGRMWAYLVCGAIVAAGGVVLAVAHGGSNGLIPLALGAANLAIGTRIALRRRRLGAAVA